ncbi:Hypothetical predicted protein [Olea europaea subsp. europaea]|uniref:Uncharacterized protein n=1 Tax=Olea europaea subsp. europaea TaxID=158383 RepID=A0A8S0TR57_OLEEU|nr:Hypothetical predicted protein [Olea europaea subsp. europaea]
MAENEEPGQPDPENDKDKENSRNVFEGVIRNIANVESRDVMFLADVTFVGATGPEGFEIRSREYILSEVEGSLSGTDGNTTEDDGDE